MARHEPPRRMLQNLDAPSSLDTQDQGDFVKNAAMQSASRAQSVPPKSRQTVIPASKSGTASNAGGLDETDFYDMFDDYPRLELTSGSEVDGEMTHISKILSNANEDWEKHVQQLRRFRGLVVAGAPNYKEFVVAMKYMDLALQASVKNLRSQVVREACVALAFLAVQLGGRCERTAEMTLPALILLIPNTVRVMATAGILAIKFIIIVRSLTLICGQDSYILAILQHVHFHKLIPIVTSQYVESKSKEIRRSCCEFIALMLTYFPKVALERHLTTIQEAIKKGISDADSEARVFARQAYGVLSEKFPAVAQLIYKDLDASQKRQLDGEMTRSTSQSSMKSSGSVSGIPASRTKSAIKVFENAGPIAALRIGGRDQADALPKTDIKGPRSSSAIDMAAARRAKAKVNTNLRPSSIRPPSKIVTTAARARPTTSTQSQPASRSGSPTGSRHPPILAKRTPMASASRGTSRENSPNRSAFGKGLSIFQPSAQSRQYPSSQPRRMNESISLGSRKNSQDSSQFGNQSDDESEHSSLASEQSLGSAGRLRGHSTSTVRSDLTEIIAQLSNGNWSVKRDGLVGFQQYMARGGKPLSHSELETVCSTFTRMMNDPSAKSIGMVLDVLHDFLRAYKLELGSSLYMFLNKLLNKQGGDLLTSIQAKVDKLMSLIRASFPADSQFQHMLRYINDNTQTPNVRVKQALLNYLLALLRENMQPIDLKNSGASRLGVTKLVNWTMDGKTTDIKRNSQLVLMAMRDLNPEEFQAMVDTLDTFLHEAALKIVSGQLRRPSTQPAEVPASPQPATPLKRNGIPTTPDNTPTNRIPRRSVPSSAPSTVTVALENEENLNPDVFTTFRQTAQEIKKFDPSTRNGTSVTNTPDRKRSTLVPQSFPDSGSKIDSRSYESHTLLPLYASREEQCVYLSSLADRIASAPSEYKHVVLLNFHEYMSLIFDDVWEDQFMTVLPLLYENLHNPQSELTAWSLSCLAQLLKLQPERMRQNQGPELLIVNVIEVQKGGSKAVVKAAEGCAFLAAGIFSCEVLVQILTPIITSQPHPDNAAAVKIYTFMVQQASKEEIMPILSTIIPLLVSAYADNEESNMRKECVYGLIYTQLKVGDELMAHFLAKLPASKIRLMNLYEKRILSHGQEPSVPEKSANQPQTNGVFDSAN